MTIRLLTDWPYKRASNAGYVTIPADSIVSVFDAATETGMIAAKVAAASAAAVTWTPPSDAPIYTELLPAEVAATRSLASAYGIQGSPAAAAATVTSPSRILNYLRNGAIVGHRGLGGYSTGTAGSIPTPDPMAGSVGTDPEGALSSILKGYALGLRCFELDVWGDNGYMCHDQDPRRVVRAPAFATGEVLGKGSYRTNAGNTYRSLTGGTCGATAPTGTALTPVSDGAVQWVWIGAALPTDILALQPDQFRDLQISANYFMGPGYENEPMPLLRDVLAALGGKCMFLLEAKDEGGGRAIASALAAFNVPTDTVLVAAFTFGWTAMARRIGFSAIQYGATADTYTPAALVAQGAVGYSSLDQDTWTATKIDAFHAAGIICGPSLNLPNRVNRDALRAIGADWLTTAEPLYLSGLGQIDDGVWTDGRWAAGMVCEDVQPALSQGGRGVLKAGSTGAKGWGFSTYTAFPKSVLMGQFVLPASFKRRFWLQIPTSGAVNQGLFMAVCCPTDAKYLDVNGNFGEGYLIRLRKNGVMDIFKTTTGMTLGAANATATATGVGTDLTTNRCQFELEVTATQVKITNITGGNVTATLTDSDYRGQFMHMGRTQATYVVDTWQNIP